MIFKYTCSECKYTFVTTNTGCEACIMCLARKLSQEKLKQTKQSAFYIGVNNVYINEKT